jgi:DNA-binding transcriptional ArsR family regulator
LGGGPTTDWSGRGATVIEDGRAGPATIAAGAAQQRAGKFVNQMVDNSVHGDILNHMVQDRSLSLDLVFHALAHPARRTMLRRLADGEQNLSQLAAPLRMSFPAASKHVRVLERARLVRRRVAGRTHLVRIEAKPLAEANEWLEGYRRFWEGSFERLDELLEEMQGKQKKRRDTEQ